MDAQMGVIRNMKTTRHQTCAGMLGAIVLSVVGLLSNIASAATVNAVWNSAADVPVTANGYTATGNTVNFTLNFTPATGTDLMVVNNTGLGFIAGTFDNLAQGQAVALSYGGVTCQFVANYYGGSGNDLVLVWAGKRPFAWGWDQYGQLGDNTSGTNRLLPVPVTATGVLAGETVVALSAGWYHSVGLCADGTVVTWGNNAYGQLGDASTTERHAPVAVNAAPGSALNGKRVVAISAGECHTLALCSDGTVAAWGRNAYGQLGDKGTYGAQSSSRWRWTRMQAFRRCMARRWLPSRRASPTVWRCARTGRWPLGAATTTVNSATTTPQATPCP